MKKNLCEIGVALFGGMWKHIAVGKKGQKNIVFSEADKYLIL